MDPEFRVTGIVRDREGRPLPNLPVRGYDAGFDYADVFVDATTDDEGRFEIAYTGTDFDELHPRKSPRNLDVVAPVNEADFGGSVRVAVDFIANVLQLDDPVRGRALDYDQLLLELNRPASFTSYIGVFGEPQRVPGQRALASRPGSKRALEPARRVKTTSAPVHRR